MDESMRTAVTTQKPVALFPKSDPSARCFYRLAEGIEEIFERPGTPRLAFSAYWQKVVERQPGRKSSPTAALAESGAQGSEDPLTQVQRQLQARVQQARAEQGSPYNVPVAQAADSAAKPRQESEAVHVEKTNPVAFASLPPNPISVEHKASGDIPVPLSNDSENAWLDLRVRMNRFTADPNTTPEQIVTLLSSVLYGFGDRLGHAAVDLVHGLLHALDPDTLTAEQKHLLLRDYERLGLDSSASRQENRLAKARYDAQGFGDQQALVQAIRSSAADVPLESLLESIKYASLIDSGSDT